MGRPDGRYITGNWICEEFTPAAKNGRYSESVRLIDL
jgi:hypothetical protein